MNKTLPWTAFIISIVALVAAILILFVQSQPTEEETEQVPNTTQTAPAEPASSQTTPEVSSEVYANPATGYTAVLPDGWTANELSATPQTCSDPQITTFSDDSNSLQVVVGVRAAGTLADISCRTGVGAGQLVAGEGIDVADTVVPSTWLITAFDGTPIEVFVGAEPSAENSLPSLIFTAGAYEMMATITPTKSLTSTPQETFEPSTTAITSLPAFSDALKLLSSIELP